MKNLLLALLIIAVGPLLAVAQQINAPSVGSGSFPLVCPTVSSGQILFSNSSNCGGITGWTTNGTTSLTGATNTTLTVGGATIGTNAFAVTGTSLFGSTIRWTYGGGITTPALALTTETNTGIDASAATNGNLYLIVRGSILGVVSGAGNLQGVSGVAVGGGAGAPNAFLTAPSSASLQFGAVDAVSPTAQTLRAQSASTGSDNGVNTTILGSLSTGSATSGDIIFRTGVKSGVSGTQATATTALTIKGETQALVTSALDAATLTGGALQVVGGASVAKRFWIPAITTSVALQTAVLCQSSGGEMIADSVACLASSAKFKNILGPVQDGAVAKLMSLPIERWTYKSEGILKDQEWTRERIGPLAEDVAKIDPRLVGYDAKGNVRSISTEQLLALTIKALQEQQKEIAALKRRLQ